MTVKRLLIIAPLILIGILLQSYFWVPTYEQQTKGNPERLREFITASNGDASILNPVLAADSASSEIIDLVFEGLLDRDEELNFRGRLARSWEIFEEAYFYINEQAEVPGAGRRSPEQVVELLRQARAGAEQQPEPVRRSLANIREISLLPAASFEVSQEEKAGEEVSKISLAVSAPARVRLLLAEVDQDLFTNLVAILGKDYFAMFPAGQYVRFIETGEAKGAGAGRPLESYAAEVLPAIEHNPVIVFHLREGVRFHDGEPLTAADVKFTYEAIMDPRNLSPRLADYEPVKEVTVIDPLTVRIVYKRLYSPALATWGIGILPAHLLGTGALTREAAAASRKPEDFSMRQSSFNRHPVGCGPFVFKGWQADQQIRLTRYQDYWEGPANYERYAWRVIPDVLTQEMEFYAGTIDNYGVQPHQVARLARDPRFQAFSGLTFGYTYIGYNMRRPLFKDPRVRRALGMAIDVDKIIRYVLYGQGERITGPFVKQTDYYNHEIATLACDPEGALKLLAEAGYRKNSQGVLEKDGKPLAFTLITNSGNDLRKAMLTVAQDAWKQLGIEVHTDLLEWSVFIQERVDKADFDAVILGWSMGLEPDLYQIWHSSQTNPYQLNFVGFSNPEADELIIKIRQEYDHDRQVQYCRRLHEIIAQEQPYTFLYVGKWTAVLDKRIVIAERNAATNELIYKPIKPTRTGSYTYHFKKWLKLPEVPVIAPEG